MHILNLEAMRAILPLLYFFCPLGLDDVSRPIQELALTPYLISEAQRCIIYGVTSYHSLPPVTEAFRTLFRTGPRPPMLALDPPKPGPENQHAEQMPCATYSLQVAHQVPVVSTRSPCVNLHVMTSKPLVQPTCSRSDAPNLANVSRVLQEMPITHDVPYSLSAGLLAWGAIWTLTAISVLLMFQKFVSVVCCACAVDGAAATIYFLSYLLFDFALRRILDNFQLAAVLLPLWQGFASGGIIVGTLCSFYRRVWYPWQNTIPEDDLSEDTTTPTSSKSPQSCVPDNNNYFEISMDMDAETDFVVMPMMVDCSMQANVVKSSISTEPTGVLPGVIRMETVPAGMGTQTDRVMVDMDIQTDLVPTSISGLMIDSEVQTDTVTITPTPARLPTDVHCPSKLAMADAGIQTDITTRITSVLALPLTFPTVDNKVSTEDLTLTLTKTAVVDIETATDSPIGSTPNCGPALTTAQVKASKNLAIGTTTTCTDMADCGIQTDVPVDSASPATVNDSQIKDPVTTPAIAAAINGAIQMYITKNSATVCSSSPVPTDAQTGYTPTPISGPLPVKVALHLDAPVPKEGVNEGERNADTATPVPLRLPSMPGPVMFPTPEDGAIDSRSSVAPRPTLRLTGAPPRPHFAATRTPGPRTSQHPPPFRPPGLGYQPYHYTTSPGPAPSHPPISANQPTRSRFASLVTQSQQLVVPAPDRLMFSDKPPSGNSSLFPSPLFLGRTTTPHPQQVSSATIPVRSVVRPFTLPVRDFTAQDPFSRGLTPTRLVPVGSDLNSAFEGRSTALSFIPSRVVPVRTAGSPALASQPLLGRFRSPSTLISKPAALECPPPAKPDPLADACPPLSSPPTRSADTRSLPSSSSPTKSAPAADICPFMEKAPPFWAPSKENSALVVVPPPKKPRNRTRVRSRRMRTSRLVETAENENGGSKDEINGVVTEVSMSGMLGGAK